MSALLAEVTGDRLSLGGDGILLLLEELLQHIPVMQETIDAPRYAKPSEQDKETQENTNISHKHSASY